MTKPQEQKTTYTIKARVPLHQWNKIQRIAFNTESNASTVLRQMIETYKKTA